MVHLTLGNFNQDSPFKQAIMDLGRGKCIVDDGQEIEIRLLIERMDFTHPLLTHPILSSSDCIYTYEYNDFSGLFDAVKFVYATLLHVSNPHDCEFIITPSTDFIRLKNEFNIPVSVNYKKKASEQISLESFNSLISRFNGFSFQYQNQFVLDQKITLNDLPSAVNGDLFYQTDSEITLFCQQAEDIARFEIRYINRFIGFGVFAREDILAGELIAPYCGLKKFTNGVGGAYVYGHKNDALNLNIDAMHYGNIARFINHAPKSISAMQAKSSINTLVSNIAGDVYGLYGNDLVIFRAKQNILKGEQLLVDYGETYFFNEADMFYIKPNGCVIDSKNKKIRESSKQRQHSLRLMSEHGIKQAQWLLIRKPLIVLIATVLFALFNWGVA